MKTAIENLSKEITLHYSFSIEEIGKYKDIIDFSVLSANENIKWDYHIIKKFEEQLYWGVLKQNIAVFERVTLGLLFPDKAELKPCDCFKKEDVCDCWRDRPKNIKLHKAQLSDINKDEYFNLKYLSLTIATEFNSDDVESILLHNKLPLRFKALQTIHKN